MAEDEITQDSLDDLAQAALSTQAKYWLRELDEAKEFYQKWTSRARNIEDTYRDEGNAKDGEIGTAKKGVNGVNILYANTETMKGAVYADPPVPVCERRFPGDDPHTRVSCEVLERALTFTVQDGELHNLMKRIRLDYLLPGRGTARIHYEVQTDEDLDDYDADQEKANGSGGDESAGMGHNNPPEEMEIPSIIDQRVSWSRVAAEDYLDSPDATWEKTRWVAFKNTLTKKKAIKRFGAEVIAKTNAGASVLNLNKEDENRSLTAQELEKIKSHAKRYEVWEIWDKARRLVWWISPGNKEQPLDCQPDPYGLHEFFPCPKPAIAVNSNATKVPLPLFWLYQDQANEINRLTKRIYGIVDAIRANGVYAGEHEDEINQIFTAENKLIGIKDFAAWMDKGGIQKLIDWMPVKEMSDTVTALYAAREKAKEELFEVSGMADIIRGQSDPKETLGAQRIKSQFATIRLEDHQQNIADFAQDMIALAGEIIAENYEPEILARITGMEMPMNDEEKQMQALRVQMQAYQAAQGQEGVTPQQIDQAIAPQIEEIMSQVTWADVLGILRDDSLRRYTVRVETNSTIKMDREQDRKERVEAIEAVSMAIAQFGPVVMSGQMPFDLFKELILFLIRGFDGAREVEAMLDEWNQPQPPQQEQAPDPAQAAKIREEGAMQREAMKQSAQAEENERQRAFEAVENEKDRKIKVLGEAVSAAQAIDKGRADRAASRQSMRSGNGA